ncbi:VpsF family polysaccharide biosynthesis protein [Devosia sp. LjRoot16]|uniref:VpsF family polysaccharide biosynthesis protein n=1 Tax=Devosia sp. LjRoot16 TaxID=3342271 RepID=UPI003ECFA1DE
MSSTSAGFDRSPTDAARQQNAVSLLFFFCVAAAFIARFAVSSQLMNRVVAYTTEAGPFYEKLHFGTYAVLFLLPVVLFSRPFLLRGDEIGKFRALVRYSGLMLLLVLFMFVTGRAGSSVVLIDTYLVTGGAGLIMLALNPTSRRLLGDVTLGLLILSAALGTLEALTQQRILPYDAVELGFRPVGLSEHPLALGTTCAIAVGFVALTNWRVWIRVACIIVLFIGAAASGARMALLVTVVEIFALIIVVPWPRLSQRHQRQAKLFVLLAAAAGGAVLTGILLSAGLLSRFTSTLFDENFFVRVSIYDVFKYVSFEQVMFGMDGKELIRIVTEKLHMPTIESAQVVIVLLFGLPVALLFAWLVIWMLLRMLRHAPLAAWIGVAATLLAALSNNTFSSKTPIVMMMIVLVLAYNANGIKAAPEKPVQA